VPIPQGRGRLLLEDKPGSRNVAIRFGCRLPDADAGTFVRYEVMGEALERRLNDALRESEGITYGFRVHPEVYRGGAAALVVEGSVDASASAASVDELRTTLDALAGAEGTEAEMWRAKWTLARRYASGFRTSLDVANAILTTRNRGWAIETIDAYPATLADVSRASVAKGFADCTQASGVLSLLGDRKITEPLAKNLLK
jgi:predicted Zn-dependent peptidase